MNLDELKETWNEETIEQVPEVSLSEQKELKSPLAVIRKNMKKEFKNNDTLTYYLCLLLVVLLIGIYYILKFKQFYKEIEKPNYSTFQSLLELNYSLKFFKELYMSCYVAFVPVLLCLYIIDNMSSLNVPIFILKLCVAFFLLYFIGKWWFNNFYGKHIAKISNLLHEVKHPYEDFDKKIIKVDEKKYWFDTTENFFTKKLGWFGKVINWIVWILGVMIIILVIGFIVGFIAGYIGAMLSN